MLAVGAVASTGPPPAPQARRASHRLLARPQALPVAIQWPVVRRVRPRGGAIAHAIDSLRGWYHWLPRRNVAFSHSYQCTSFLGIYAWHYMKSLMPHGIPYPR